MLEHNTKRKADAVDKPDMEAIFKTLKQREWRIHIHIPKTISAVRWEELQEIFTKYGKVLKVSVPEHKKFAFVTFENEEDMESALSTQVEYKDEKLIMKKSYEKEDINHALGHLSTKKTKLVHDPEVLVFLAPLNHKTTMDKIIDTFETFGDLAKVYLPLRRNGIDNIGIATLTFENALGASKALAAGSIEIDEVTVNIQKKKAKRVKKNGTHIVIDDDEVNDDDHYEYTEPQKEDSLPGADEGTYCPTQECTLYDIPENTSAQNLLDVYCKYGKILNVTFVKSSEDDKSSDDQNTARVIFANAASVKKVMKAGPITINNCSVSSSSKDAHGERSLPYYLPQNVIFAGNLDFDWDSRDLREHFSTFGEIENVDLPMDEQAHCNKGYALVTFTNDSGAIAVLKKKKNAWKIGSRVMAIVGRDDYIRNEAKEKQDKASAAKREVELQEQVEVERLQKERENDMACALGIEEVDVDDIVSNKKLRFAVDNDDEADDDSE